MAEKALDQQAADEKILKVLQFKVWYLREKGLNELCVYHEDSEKSRLISDLIKKQKIPPEESRKLWIYLKDVRVDRGTSRSFRQPVESPGRGSRTCQARFQQALCSAG